MKNFMQLRRLTTTEILQQNKELSFLQDVVEFKERDAETIDLPPSAFDAAFYRWGLMFLPDLRVGLSNIYGSLVHGGHFAVPSLKGIVTYLHHNRLCHDNLPLLLHPEYHSKEVAPRSVLDFPHLCRRWLEFAQVQVQVLVQARFRVMLAIAIDAIVSLPPPSSVLSPDSSEPSSPPTPVEAASKCPLICFIMYTRR
jgi:hypothetical protein